MIHVIMTTFRWHSHIDWLIWRSKKFLTACYGNRFVILEGCRGHTKLMGLQFSINKPYCANEAFSNPTVQDVVSSQKEGTSARKISKANPLKQLITACWMSSPRLSRALIVESKRPGLRLQNIWIFTALPSLALTSTYKYKKICMHHLKPIT